MKIQTKITMGFTIEIVSFILVGFFLASFKYIQSIAFLIFAMVFALSTGKLIAEDAIEKYKIKEKLK